jgi:hypothetical protein
MRDQRRQRYPHTPPKFPRLHLKAIPQGAGALHGHSRALPAPKGSPAPVSRFRLLALRVAEFSTCALAACTAGDGDVGAPSISQLGTRADRLRASAAAA